MLRFARPATAGLIACIFLAAAPATAAASPAYPDNFVREATAGSSKHPDAVGCTMNGLLAALDVTGYGNLPVPEIFVEETPDYPFATDATIIEPEVVAREVEQGRLERWSVASPAMQRVVEVQIYRAADANIPAPQLFLLDGVSGTDNAGWVREGYVQDAFATENVTIVMPNQATGSMYTDWQQEDPALGHMKWETFLTSELAPLMAAEESLNYNNHRGIGGLSMGAGAAVRIANLHPSLFDSVIGISGCYSTLDQLGLQTTKMTVESRGADTTNMWGPFGSEDWVRNDVVQDPSGLESMAVYLSAGNGVIGADDFEEYSDRPAEDMGKGVILEHGALICTQNLVASMEGHGMTHQVVEYTPTGAHNWTTYGAQLRPGWEAVKGEMW